MTRRPRPPGPGGTWHGRRTGRRAGGALAAVAAGLAAAAATGCPPGRGLVVGPDERLGPGTYTVDRVGVGWTDDQVEAALGPAPHRHVSGQPLPRPGEPPPPRDPTAPPPAQETWKYGDTTVSLAGGVVREVSGRTLRRDDATIAASGIDEAEVFRALGRGRVVRSWSPKGSGVITTGYVPASVSYVYHDGSTEYTLYCYVPNGEQVQWIHARPLPTGRDGPRRARPERARPGAPAPPQSPAPGAPPREQDRPAPRADADTKTLVFVALAGLLLFVDGVFDLKIFAAARRRHRGGPRRGIVGRLLVLAAGGACLLAGLGALVQEALRSR